MGSAVVSPSAALGRMLRQSRKRRGWTLKRVSAQCQSRGEPIPLSTLAKIEQGKVDPGIRRLHMLLQLYQIPIDLVGDMVELEEQAADPPETEDLEALFRDGVEHWRRGDLANGLAHLMAIRQLVPDDDASRELRQEATLAFCVMARNLGKYGLAKQLVDRLLCEPPAPRFMLQALVVASGLWRGSGSLEVALALIDRAQKHIDPADPLGAAYVYHQQAKLYLQSGQPELAEQRLDEVLAIYRERQDTHNELRALALRAEVLRSRGAVAEALTCAEQVIEIAEEHGRAHLAVTGYVERGRLEIQLGRIDAGLASLREGLSGAVRLDDKSAQFLAHYELWKAYEQIDDPERARFEKQAAMYFVRSVDETSPEVLEVRRLVAEEGEG